MLIDFKWWPADQQSCQFPLITPQRTVIEGIVICRGDVMQSAEGVRGEGGCSDFECRRHQVFSIQVSLSVLNNAARITHSIKSAGVRDFRLHCLLQQWESRVWGTIFCRYVIRIVPRERKGAGEIKSTQKLIF